MSRNCYIFVLLVFLVWMSSAFGQNSIADHVVISEIQIAGDADSDDEFVELYNPTGSTIDLTDWRLTRKTSSGTESNLLTTFPPSSIAAHSFILIASPEYDGSTSADLTYSTSGHLASNNTVVIYSDAGVTVVDKVGLGTATDAEGSTIENPEDDGSVERKASAFSTAATLGPGGVEENAGNGQDTDDNSADFVQQTTSNPQNSSSPPENDIAIPVELTSFAASVMDNGVMLSWATATETENLGFHIFRSVGEDKEFAQITTELIAGAGSSAEAHEYAFVDEKVEGGNTYYYKLADVDFNGRMQFHGPVSVTIGGMPEEYALMQNYPNPFNPNTTISFSLPEAGEVRLAVFNMLGQKIRTLVSGNLEAGGHSVLWDGMDANGRRVSSGVYVYKLQAGDFSHQKKLVLMK